MQTIKVTQSASEKFAPDCVELELRLSSEHKKYSEAVKGLSEQCDRVQKLLCDAHLEKKEIVTGGSAVDTFTHEGKKLFRAHTEIRTSLSLSDARVPAAFDALEASGLAWSQSYALKNDALRTQVLQKAVKEARKAAETIAAACGVKVGPLQNVEYASHGDRPMLMRTALMQGGGAATPENIEVSETVTCEWKVE